MNTDPQTFQIITILFAISLTVSLLGTHLVRLLAIKYHIGEQPNLRKIHKIFTPHMGGLGIFSGFLAGLILAIFLLPSTGAEIIQNFTGLLVASFLIVGLGAFDDLKGLDASRKFIGQFIIVSILIFTGCKIESIQIPFWTTIPLGVFSIPITYLWLIGVSNAVNLLDGLDGLAAGFSAIAASVIGIIAWQHHNLPLVIISTSLVAGLLGFLKFNFYPAKIFMGDTGSLFLGLILAALSLKTFESEPGQINFLLPLIILAIPIGDTAVAFFRRLNNGRHPFKPDKDHFHHRLIYLGLSHKHAVLVIYATSFVFAISAYFVATQTLFVSIILIIAILIGSFFSLKRIGYLEAKRKKIYYGEATIIPVKKEIAPLSIKRFVHKFLFALNDIVLINASLFVTWWLKYESGWFAVDRVVPFSEFWATPVSLILTLFWLILFVLNNLYSISWYVSRFDHLRRMMKVILFGIFLIFILTLDPGAMLSGGRLTVLIYAVVLIMSLSAGRLMLIQLEKYFSILEYTSHKTMLIGATEKGRKLLKDIRGNPHLLYRMVGYVTKEYQDKKFYGLDCLGTYSQISRLVREHGIEEIIIAINERSRDEILNIVAMTGNTAVAFKILPEMYDVVSGSKTVEMSGHPLIQLFPEPMHLWQWGLKRSFDIAISFIMLVLLSPVFLVSLGFLVFSGIYPPFIIENVIGKYGRRFGMLNLQTSANGKRAGAGKLIYYTRFYKFPALLNILLGHMSFVGPRPEENENFEAVRKKIKFYNRRFQIRPGLTGWAQVRYRYEEALKYKREQLKQDLYYLENMSLTLDLRILLRSVVIFFLGFKKTK